MKRAFLWNIDLSIEIKYGNRLIMMCDGKIIFDVEGEEKKKLEVKDLLDKFNTAGGIVSDAMMLG